MSNFYARRAATSTIEDIVKIRTRKADSVQRSIWAGLILTCLLISALPGEVSAAPPDPVKPQPTPVPETLIRAKPEKAPPARAARILATGGPDGGGYIFRDSDESDGPSYDWESIQSSGTSVTLNDDQMSDAIPIGFTFDFYGEDYSSLYICSNGFVTFLPGQPCPFSSDTAPSGSLPNAIIAAWWEDLNPGKGGTIHYETLGTAPNRRLIVQFTNVPHFWNRNRSTFQIKLFEGTQFIEVHYSHARDDNDPHLAGIEDREGQAGLEYYYGDDSSLQSIAVRYWRPNLALTKTADNISATVGQSVIYSITVGNGLDTEVVDAVISDTLPSGLTFTGPATITPPQPGAVLATTDDDLPTVASNVTIPAGGAVIVEFPITIETGALGGRIANTAEVTSAATGAWTEDSVEIFVSTCRVQIEGDSSPPYTSIQEAVADAHTNDILEIAGYCPESNHIGGRRQAVYLSKSLVLRGGYSSDLSTWDPSAYTTTIDGMDQGRVIYIDGGVAPTVEHLQIVGGNAQGQSGSITGADAGGGIHVAASSPTIRHCTLTNNTAGATGWGGGIHFSQSNGTVINNIIRANSALYGGGIELSHSDTVTIEGNQITDNTATYGGGIDLYISDARLEGNTLRLNHAEIGGAVYIEEGSPALTNTLIVDNRSIVGAPGLHIQNASPQIDYSTIARNTGGNGIGIHVVPSGVSNVILSNTILAGHTTGIEVTSGNAATLTRTLWHNTTNQFGDGTITTSGDLYGDPLFVDPDAGDYRIDTESPAFDAGIQTGVVDDIDGDPRDPRPLPDPPDIGADENPSLTVRRPIASTMTFGAAKAVIDFADPGSVSFVTVTMVLDYPVEQSSRRPVRRHYVIHADSAEPFDATLNFYYHQEDFDLSDIPDEGELIAYREVDGEWIAYDESSVDADNNILTVPNVTGFSRWALGAPGYEPSPTAVDLADFTATGVENGVRIEWETAMEIDNLGFNLYRADAPEGPYAKLNETLIPAQMLGQVMGARYTWDDTTAATDQVHYYRLEDLDIFGVSTFHGPVSNEPAATGGGNGPSAVALTALDAWGSPLLYPTSLLAAGLAVVGSCVGRRRGDH